MNNKIKIVKTTLLILLLLTTGTKAVATEWTTYVCYFVDTTSVHITYLRPVAYYECLSSSLKGQASSIMDRFVDYNPVFDYEKLEGDEDNLHVYLKTKALSKIERQELITSLLMHGFDRVTIVFAGATKRTFSKADIDMPFFLPVYFEDMSASNEHFINNAWKMIRLAIEADACRWECDNTVTHIVSKGETVYGIAKQYGILEDELLENNPEINDSPLQIGQKLIIYIK